MFFSLPALWPFLRTYSFFSIRFFSSSRFRVEFVRLSTPVRGETTRALPPLTAETHTHTRTRNIFLHSSRVQSSYYTIFLSYGSRDFRPNANLTPSVVCRPTGLTRLWPTPHTLTTTAGVFLLFQVTGWQNRVPRLKNRRYRRCPIGKGEQKPHCSHN